MGKVGLLERFFAFFKKHFPKLTDKLTDIKTNVGEIFETVFGASSLLIKVVFIFQAILSLISLIVSVILLYLNFDNIKDLIVGIKDGSDTWLDKIVNLFSQYPTFNSLISEMDSNMTSLSGSYFSPAVTFTSILQTFGIGDAVNTILTTALQGIAFVISIRLLMWSMGRLKLSITKPLG